MVLSLVQIQKLLPSASSKTLPERSRSGCFRADVGTEARV